MDRWEILIIIVFFGSAATACARTLTRTRA
jgi:hypothetical protein